MSKRAGSIDNTVRYGVRVFTVRFWEVNEDGTYLFASREYLDDDQARRVRDAWVNHKTFKLVRDVLSGMNA